MRSQRRGRSAVLRSTKPADSHPRRSPALSRTDDFCRADPPDIVDETWASWALPSRVCFGDSGGPTLFNPHPVSGPFDLQLVAVASDGGIDCASAQPIARGSTHRRHSNGLQTPFARSSRIAVRDAAFARSRESGWRFSVDEGPRTAVPIQQGGRSAKVLDAVDCGHLADAPGIGPQSVAPQIVKADRKPAGKRRPRSSIRVRPTA